MKKLKAQTYKLLFAFLAIIVIVAMIANYMGYIDISAFKPQEELTTTTTTTSPASWTDAYLPLEYQVYDPYNTTAVSTIVCQTYLGEDGSQPSGGAVTTGVTGTVTTQGSYHSGDILTVKMSRTNFVSRFFTFQVPQIMTSGLYTQTSIPIRLEVCSEPAISIIVQRAGTVYTSNSTKLNFTTLGTTSVSISVTIQNTEDNSGMWDSKDILNSPLKWNTYAYCYSNSTGVSVTPSSLIKSAKWGSTTYYGTQIPANSITRIKQGTTVKREGAYVFSLTVNKGSLAHNDTEQLSIKVTEYGDWSLFQDTNSFGDSSAQLGSTFLLLLCA